MKKIFIDTNVVIDFLANREPFHKAAYEVFLMGGDEKVKLYISALSFTTIYYVLRKQYEAERLLSLLRDLRLLVAVVATNDYIIEQALESNFSDFEDAVQYYTAASVGADYIVTRNTRDYSHASISVVTPGELSLRM